jgi:hypothetical protein
MKNVLVVIICLVLCNPAFAKRIQKITDGAPAPYSGYVIDEAQEAHFRAINEAKLLEEEKNRKLAQLQKITEAETEHYKEAYFDTKKDLDKEQKAVVIKCGLFFVGGVLMTLGVGWAVLLAL